MHVYSWGHWACHWLHFHHWTQDNRDFGIINALQWKRILIMSGRWLSCGDYGSWTLWSWISFLFFLFVVHLIKTVKRHTSTLIAVETWYMNGIRCVKSVSNSFFLQVFTPFLKAKLTAVDWVVRFRPWPVGFIPWHFIASECRNFPIQGFPCWPVYQSSHSLHLFSLEATERNMASDLWILKCLVRVLFI